MLFSPVTLWDEWTPEIKQLVIKVWFNNCIYYSKTQGCRTDEISALYLTFKNLEELKFSVLGGAENWTPVWKA
jgi:hypothetical protein